jgi:photosystem II stability/assembly factor-like uncharacterized protein
MRYYLLIFICCFFSLSGFSQTWEHLTPIKSSDRLKSAFVLNDSTAYMGGFFGRLVKTTNGGQSWSQVDDVTGYPISGGIWGMDFPSVNVGYIPDDAGRIYKTTDASASWTQIYLSTSSNFYDCYFFNTDTGFVCGEFGELLKTEDGGDSWNTIETGVTTRLYDFCFTSDSVGFIALRSGDILTTADSGNTWGSIGLSNTNDLYHIDFANDTLGIAVGLYGTVLRTVDGGETWETISVSTLDRLTSVLFIDAETVLITGDYGLLLRSTDGGESFSSEIDFTVYNLWGLLHFPGGLNYAFGDRVVLESTDGGDEWDYRFDGVPQAQLMRMHFTDSVTIHAVGREAFYGNTRSAIIKSSDKGRVWHTTYEALGSNGDVTDLSFINENVGFASAYNTIRKTTNGGETNWAYDNEEGYFTAIHFFNADTGLVGNTLDGIFLSVDGGSNWEQVDACGDVNHFFFLDRDTGYAAVDGGSIRKTTDGGATWIGLNVGVGYNLQSVFFVNDSTGYAVGDWINGVKTTDYGATWSSLPVNQYGRDIYCPDPNNPDSVYALVASGEIQKSIDGGANWTIAMPALNNQQMWDFEFQGPYIYVCGDHGDILRTRLVPCTTISSIIDTTVCGSFIAPDGDILNSSGSYTFSYLTADGCDSVLTINLTVNTNTTSSRIDTACFYFEAPDGEVLMESGNYEVIIPNQAGCDSIINIDLTINSVDVSIIDSSPTLSSNASGAVYQWIDCGNNFQAIEGETEQLFTATENGSYALIITQENCTDTSDCIVITNTSIEEDLIEKTIHVYPIPAKGSVTIEFAKSYHEITIDVYYLNGAKYKSAYFTDLSKVDIDIESPGFYILEIRTDKEDFARIKLINE